MIGLLLLLLSLPAPLLLWYFFSHSKQSKLQQRLARYQQQPLYPTTKSIVGERRIKQSLVVLLLKISTFGLMQYFNQPQLRQQMRKAGWFHPNAPGVFLGSIALMAIALTVVILLLILFSASWAQRLAGSPVRILLTIAFVGILCARLPKMVLSFSTKRYGTKLTRELPNLFELYLISIAAGFSGIQAWTLIQCMMRDIYPKTYQLIDLFISELQSLPTKDDAWNNFMNRVDSQDIRDAIRIMHQCEVNGLPMENDLNRQIREIRKEYLATIELKIAKLPTILLLPLMVFIFPSLFVFILGPGIIKASALF